MTIKRAKKEHRRARRAGYPGSLRLFIRGYVRLQDFVGKAAKIAAGGVARP